MTGRNSHGIRKVTDALAWIGFLGTLALIVVVCTVAVAG